MFSDKYVSDGFLPDKAFDLLDSACSRRTFNDVKCNNKQNNKQKLLLDMEKAVATGDFTKAQRLQAKLADLKYDQNNQIKIAPQDIAKAVAEKTGIPLENISSDKNANTQLLKLESVLCDKVIGQNDAISRVAGAIRRGRAGLRDGRRPVGCFLFVGESGVGKTELAKQLAAVIAPTKTGFIRFDMSEYMEQHSVAKLIGSPPGYVGYDQGGKLLEQVRHNPNCVVLFDEFDKAHPDMQNILLQILEEGVLTNSSGQQVSFSNSIVILTANIGVKSALGFSKK